MVKLAFQPAEYGSPLTIELRAVAADGSPVSPPRRIAVQPTPRPGSIGDSVPFPFVHNMRDLRFQTEGPYRFEVLANGVVMASVELDVVAVSLLPADVKEAIDQIVEGFAAFRRGDHDLAERIFREVVQAQPDLGIAHSNLGFTLLVKQDAAGALQEFQRASELGYQSQQAMLPNVGCPAATSRVHLQKRLVASRWRCQKAGPQGYIPICLLPQVRSSPSYCAAEATTPHLWQTMPRVLPPTGRYRQGACLGGRREAARMTVPDETEEHHVFGAA